MFGCHKVDENFNSKRFLSGVLRWRFEFSVLPNHLMEFVIEKTFSGNQLCWKAGGHKKAAKINNKDFYLGNQYN